MIDKMRELTDRQMLDFVKELEKRRIPLHSVLIAQHGKLIFEKYYALLHWQSACWSRKGKFPCRILSVIIFRNICLGECIPGWQR